MLLWPQNDDDGDDDDDDDGDGDGDDGDICLYFSTTINCGNSSF